MGINKKNISAEILSHCEKMGFSIEYFIIESVKWLKKEFPHLTVYRFSIDDCNETFELNPETMQISKVSYREEIE